MDLDGDGKKDLVSGSYPGDIYLLRGLGRGKFAEGKAIVDAKQFGAGKKIGYRVKPFVVDWNKDGLPDLLLGSCLSDKGATHGYVWLYLRQKS